MHQSHKLLVVYSAVLTVALALSMVTRAPAGPSLQSLDVLDVKRINLREEDGTLRMVISNTSRFPGILVHGKERPHPDRHTAGMLFFNDEGTENGGLIFGGARSNGKVTNYGHLSFDQYEQDQVLTVSQNEEDGARTAGINIQDRPQAPLDFDLIERLHAMPDGPAKEAQRAVARQSGQFGFTRLTVGKTADHASVIKLMDDRGRARLTFRVEADGQAAIDFLDEKGRVVRSFTGKTPPERPRSPYERPVRTFPPCQGIYFCPRP